jgi:hypothetical protein
MLHWSTLPIGSFEPREETFAFSYFRTVAGTQEALPDHARDAGRLWRLSRPRFR